MEHTSKVPIRIHKRHLQNILKFANCGPPFEGRKKWIMDHGTLRLGPTLTHMCDEPPRQKKPIVAHRAAFPSTPPWATLLSPAAARLYPPQPTGMPMATTSQWPRGKSSALDLRCTLITCIRLLRNLPHNMKMCNHAWCRFHNVMCLQRSVTPIVCMIFFAKVPSFECFLC